MNTVCRPSPAADIASDRHPVAEASWQTESDTQGPSLSFDRAWKQMQDEYRDLCAAISRDGHAEQEPQFVHPLWRKFKEPIRQLILGPPNPRFLDHPTLGETMVRRGFAVCQEYELSYLQDCIGENARQRLARFRDADVPLPRECSALNCSTNTLGHLYYATKALESFDPGNPHVICEFGGGYGNLARIFKLLVPSATLAIIDLPELIALQFLFLRTTMNRATVLIHHRPPGSIEPGSIHLFPVFGMDEFTLPVDLFISTFALSETPDFVQRMVAGKRFFQAGVTYLAGQLHGGFARDELVQHQILHQAVRDVYQEITCQPFHFFQTGVRHYEIVGRAPRPTPANSLPSTSAEYPKSSSGAEPKTRGFPGLAHVSREPVVLIKLQGGLGNQMFQYAAGLAIARRTHARLTLDLSFLRDRTPRPNFTYRDYDLDIFNLDPDCEVVEDAGERTKGLSCHRERQFHFDPGFEGWGPNLYLDGYFQSPRYFESVRDEVRRTFTSFRTPLTPPQQALAETIAGCNAVCLNVRRGDFVSNPSTHDFHGVCSEGYYAVAVDRILRRCPDARFFIFSDDVEWCRTADLARGAPCTLVTHDYAGDRFGAYLQLMMKCRHFILPNSSFGWWAAFLATMADKMVFVPEPWFDDPGNDTRDLFPAAWIRIPKYTEPLRVPRSTDPAVSVVVVCHNYGRYLPEAVASVLNQRFRDLEIVLIDDGSTDDSRTVAERLAAEESDGTSICVHHLNDVGPAAARQFGLEQARGRYVVVLDADDKLAPDHLAKTVPWLETDPKMGFVYVGIRYFGENNEIAEQPEYDFAKFCRDHQGPCCALVRKSACLEAGGYDRENWGYYADWQLRIRLGARGWNGHRVNEPLYFHRCHSDSSLGISTRRLDRVSRAFVVSRQQEAYTAEEFAEAQRTLREMPAGWHRRPPLREVDQLRALLRERPDDENAMFLLARALANAGHKTESARWLCQLLSRRPDDGPALKLLEILADASVPDGRGPDRPALSEEVLRNDFGVGLFSFSDHLSETTLLQGNRDQLEFRRVAINGLPEPSIYLHPPAQLRFEVSTVHSGRLAGAIAMQPEVWDKPHAGGCEFTLVVDGREAFRKAINPTQIPSDRRWHEFIVEVPACSSGAHEFIFRTQAIGTPAYSRWALWRRPVFLWRFPQVGADDQRGSAEVANALSATKRT